MEGIKSTSSEDALRAEVADLKRQLEEQKNLHQSGANRTSAPSTLALLLIGLVIAALIVVGFFTGYLPRQRRERVLAAESQQASQSLPVVTVTQVTRSDQQSELVLPGNIQAVTEAPVLARASGYIKKRYVDIGDRVKEGQV